ncbi:hypothetical protein [Flagellimonas sp. 2504JD1-5]
MTKIKFKTISYILVFLIFVNISCKENLVNNGIYVTYESSDINFDGEHYGFVTVINDTIRANSYGLPNDGIYSNEKKFFKVNDNTYQSIYDSDKIKAIPLNDSIIQIDFEDEITQRYLKLESKTNIISLNLENKRYRYKLGENSYSIAFKDNGTAIGVNEATSDTVKYDWKKIVLSNNVLIILNNDLYSYHLRVDSLKTDEIILSRFVENTAQIRFKEVEIVTNKTDSLTR